MPLATVPLPHSPLHRRLAETMDDVLAMVTGLALLTVWVAAATSVVAGWPGATTVKMVAFVVFVAATVARLGSGGRVILALTGVSAVALPLIRPDWLSVVTLGLDKAGTLAAFFTALAFLRLAAGGSVAMGRCGEMLVTRPPGQRYWALTIGGTLFTIILNFGSLALLGGILRRENTVERARGDETVRAIREKRMVLAMSRGFAATVLLSPLSVALTVVTLALPGVDWRLLLTVGAGFAAVHLTAGWLWDRVTMPRARPGSGRDNGLGWSAIWPLLGVVVAITLAAILVEGVFATSLALGVTIAVPVFSLAWMVTRGVDRDLGRDLGRLVTADLAVGRMEVLIVSASTFLGVALTALVPMDAARDAINALGLGAYGVLVVLFLAVPLLGQVGLNPVVSVAVLGGLVTDPTVFGVHPLAMGLCFLSAWTTTNGTSTSMAGALLLGRVFDLPPALIFHRWNVAFAITAGAALLAMTLAAQALLTGAV